MKKIATLLISLVFLQMSCIEPNKPFDKMAPGLWRGILYLDGNTGPIVASEDETVQMPEIEGELPFNFEVKYLENNNLSFEFINGDERIIVTDIKYGLDRETAKDTLEIYFKEFDTELKGIYENGIIEGHWIVNYKENYQIPFKAVFGKNYRFLPKDKEPLFDITGDWKAVFEPGSEDAYNAIGQFKQNGKELTGTFSTETGDYRYLDGQIYDNKFRLSAFDGAHAFLFEGKVANEDSIIGSFRSGKHYKSNWVAKKGETENYLMNPFEMTQYDTEKPLNFILKDSENQELDITQSNHKKIIQITGTWCPNCKDETQFLKSYYQKKPDDVDIIAVAFERYDDEAKNIDIIKTYKEKMGFPYPILLGGKVGSAATKSAFPQLDGIHSYPTILFVDGDNRIKKVFTGYYGPATQEYEHFKKQFEDTVEKL
ncbi:MAG: TlpA disulfide reductase family protein [Saprospiraceae bacterium]